MSKKGFSFVEVIIVIAILTLLAVIGVSINSQYKQNSENTRISSDASSLENSFTQYKQETSKLPLPGGNLSYFGTDASYVHPSTPGAFGVHGYITENILPKKYLNYLPIDPRTQQYYAYGKTINDTSFEVSGVTKDGLDFISFVKGTYNGEGGPLNLIREYNGPDFVFDTSKENFPYNPEEKAVTGKIVSFSGSVSINDTITTEDQILSYTLRSGDSVLVDVGGYANIYFGDGSMSTLGDPTTESRLKIATMQFAGANNLVTKIQLALNIGSLWTQASTMGSDSSFEVFTSDTTAAVRGTEFGIAKLLGSTNVSIKDGKVKIGKIDFNGSLNDLAQVISLGEELQEQVMDLNGVTNIVNEAEGVVTYLEAGIDQAKGISMDDAGNIVYELIPTKIQKNITNNLGVKLLSLDTQNSLISIKLGIHPRLLAAKHVMITDISDNYKKYISEDEVSQMLDSESNITINQAHRFKDTGLGVLTSRQLSLFAGKTILIQLCEFKKCTRPLTVKLPLSANLTELGEGTDALKKSGACALSFTNPKTGKCYENRFANLDYSLVGIVDYTDKTSSGNILGPEQKVILERYGSITSPQYDITKVYKTISGKLLGVQHPSLGATPIKIKYHNLDALHLGDDYIIELRTSGSGFTSKTSGNSLLLSGNHLLKYDHGYKKFYTAGSYAYITSFTPTSEKLYDIAIFGGKEKMIEIKEVDSTISPFPVVLSSPALAQNPTGYIYIGGEESNQWQGLIKGIKIYKKVPPADEGSDKTYIKRKGSAGSATPEVYAGADRKVVIVGAAPQNIGVHDAEVSDPDGGVLEYIWSKISGPTSGGTLTGSLSGTGSGIMSPFVYIMNLLTPGDYEYKLSATSSGDTVSDTLKVKVETNFPPVVNAGSDMIVTYPGLTASIGGTASDPNGDTLNLIWTLISKPSGCTYSPLLTNINTPNLGISDIRCIGVYKFSLNATDPYGSSVNDEIIVERKIVGTISGTGCSMCPLGVRISDTNRDDERYCPFFCNKKDEAYCRYIFGNNPADTRNYNKDVICARKEFDSIFDWTDWDQWNWIGEYVP